MKRNTKLRTRPFGPAEYLDTPEAIAAYLTDALASGSSDEFKDALNAVVRARGMTEVRRVIADLDTQALTRG